MTDANTLPESDDAAPSSKLSPDELRRQRGLIIAALCPIKPEGKDNRYRVPSQQGGASYLVTLDRRKGPNWQCTCKDFEARKEACKHVYAVEFMIGREKQPDDSTTATITEKLTKTLTLTDRYTLATQTVAPRKTYKQDWAAYNAAQMNEKPKFLALLHDLCQIIEEPSAETYNAKGGRPRVPLRDIVFGAVYKVFSTLSGRRFTGDLMEAKAKGLISQAPHYNTVSKYLEMDGLAPILQALIERSALPLRAVETEFCVDSSGFTSSKFIRWFDQKYGTIKQEHDWVKAHAICGVQTNIVTAVRVGRHHSADCPEFIPLLKATAQNFTIRECSADSAYCSYDNFEAVDQYGGKAYIAFKVNSNGVGGGAFEKMFHLFSYNKEEYTALYHKRSNIESTFAAVKAKYGDSVRSKSEAAMRNEVLCKILCFNISRVILATYEPGIEATFFATEETPEDAPEAIPTNPVPMASDPDWDALAWI
jgi:transposase